jgi:hypothetical protein
VLVGAERERTSSVQPADDRVRRPRLVIQVDELSEIWVTFVHDQLAALGGPS